MGLNSYNRLPAYIEERSYNVNEFKCILKNCLYSNAFYTLDE
jgi:hypothetical protein